MRAQAAESVLSAMASHEPEQALWRKQFQQTLRNRYYDKSVDTKTKLHTLSCIGNIAHDSDLELLQQALVNPDSRIRAQVCVACFAR